MFTEITKQQAIKAYDEGKAVLVIQEGGALTQLGAQTLQELKGARFLLDDKRDVNRDQIQVPDFMKKPARRGLAI